MSPEPGVFLTFPNAGSIEGETFGIAISGKSIIEGGAGKMVVCIGCKPGTDKRTIEDI